MLVQKITFDEIYGVWSKRLWPGRNSPIEPASSMLFLGGYNISIKTKYKPSFWGIFENDTIIGVNSGVSTSDDHYRSRGTWVDPQYRGQSLSLLLFREIEKQAIEEGRQLLWSIPRKSALPAYEKFGFVKIGDWFDEGMEFGPNCYVKKDIE